MARIARVVALGIPHHVTQRGNRRQATFFCPDDYQADCILMEQWCRKCEVALGAYCRWQGRFASCPLDESYLLAAARYIE